MGSTSRWSDSEESEKETREDVKRKSSLSASKDVAGKDSFAPSKRAKLVGDEREGVEEGRTQKQPETQDSAAVLNRDSLSDVDRRESLDGTCASIEDVGKLCCRGLSNYEILHKVSEGSFGVVYEAKSRATGKTVALKEVKNLHLTEQGFPVTSLREVNILLSLSHSNLVTVHEIVTETLAKSQRTSSWPFKVFMVMDFWKHELRELLESKPEPFSQSEVKCIFTQVLSGLRHLHSHKIVHRDLKTSNILYNNKGEVAIADLGSARRLASEEGAHRASKELTDLVITLNYRPPELLLGLVGDGRAYGCEVDIWSAGCIFAELLANKQLFTGRNESQVLTKIFELVGNPCEEPSPLAGAPRFPQLFTLLKKHPNQSIPYLIPPSPEEPMQKFHHRNPMLRSFLVAGERGRKGEQQLRQAAKTKLDGLFPRASVTSGSYLSASGVELLKQLLLLDPSTRLRADEALKHPWFSQFPLAQEKAKMPKFYDSYKKHKQVKGEGKAGAPSSHQTGLFSQGNRYLI